MCAKNACACGTAPKLIFPCSGGSDVGALTDQADGLAAIRIIVAAAPGWMHPGGWLFFEHGYDQAAAARDLLVAAGFAAIEQHCDLAGIVRASGGRYCISRE